MQQQQKAKLIDPVCGMEVSAASKFHSYYNNGTYYFCSAKDKEEFDKQPEKYAKEEVVSSSCD
jgi:Cu+-exporting ATPase